MSAVRGQIPMLQTALRVADLERSAQFYLGLPGFSQPPVPPHGFDREQTLLVEGPGGVALLLASRSADLSGWQGLTGSGKGAWVYLHRPGLAALMAQLDARGLEGVELVEPYPGYRHLLLPDPDGYTLAFWEWYAIPDEQVLALYRAGVERLQAALEGLDEAGLDLPRAPGKWTIRQILHHLVDSDMATFHVIQMALALPGRQIQSDLWEPDRWMEGLRSDQRPVGPATLLFAAARSWVQEALNHLPDGLERSVSWPSGYQADVRNLLRQAGGHALHHIIQIEETRRRHS